MRHCESRDETRASKSGLKLCPDWPRIEVSRPFHPTALEGVPCDVDEISVADLEMRMGALECLGHRTCLSAFAVQRYLCERSTAPMAGAKSLSSLVAEDTHEIPMSGRPGFPANRVWARRSSGAAWRLMPTPAMPRPTSGAFEKGFQNP